MNGVSVKEVNVLSCNCNKVNRMLNRDKVHHNKSRITSSWSCLDKEREGMLSTMCDHLD